MIRTLDYKLKCLSNMKRITIVPILFFEPRVSRSVFTLQSTRQIYTCTRSQNIWRCLNQKESPKYSLFSYTTVHICQYEQKNPFHFRLESREITYFWRWNLRLLLSTSKKWMLRFILIWISPGYRPFLPKPSTWSST